jgi:hypothetical protein
MNDKKRKVFNQVVNHRKEVIIVSDVTRDSSDFIPLKNGFGIQPLGPSPEGGDIHETFQVDQEGNMSGGHTTIRLPGDKDIQLPWPK